jgi:hypothetical protein
MRRARSHTRQGSKLLVVSNVVDTLFVRLGLKGI